MLKIFAMLSILGYYLNNTIGLSMNYTDFVNSILLINQIFCQYDISYYQKLTDIDYKLNN